MLNGLDLFSGIGGMSLALSEWVRPIAYCEIDPYCQAVLLSRMADGNISKAPIWDDIKTLQAIPPFNIFIEIIYGGFPCQEISVAGNGKGLAGERSGLFFEIVRLAKEIKPKFLFLENVPAITTRGGLQVVREIAEMGYDCRWCVISAASVGALHKRERWFLLAHANDNGSSASKDGRSIGEMPSSGKSDQEKQIRESKGTSGVSLDVANSASESANGHAKRKEASYSLLGNASENVADTGKCWPFESVEHWQKTVSEMDKCSDGIPNHTHRLRALGNAVVPQQAKEAFKMLMGI